MRFIKTVKGVGATLKFGTALVWNANEVERVTLRTCGVCQATSAPNLLSHRLSPERHRICTVEQRGTSSEFVEYTCNSGDSHHKDATNPRSSSELQGDFRF